MVDLLLTQLMAGWSAVASPTATAAQLPAWPLLPVLLAALLHARRRCRAAALPAANLLQLDARQRAALADPGRHVAPRELASHVLADKRRVALLPDRRSDRCRQPLHRARAWMDFGM